MRADRVSTNVPQCGCGFNGVDKNRLVIVSEIVVPLTKVAVFWTAEIVGVNILTEDVDPKVRENLFDSEEHRKLFLWIVSAR